MRQAPENRHELIRNYREMHDLRQTRKTRERLETIGFSVAPDWLKRKKHGTNYIAQENQSLKIQQ